MARTEPTARGPACETRFFSLKKLGFTGYRKVRHSPIVELSPFRKGDFKPKGA